jgi:hypothetical protein
MALFVANTSKQHVELHYWVEGVSKKVVTKIKPGEQVEVYKQGSHVDHQRIVDQHKIYGLIPVSEIDRSQAFVGQCYQFDKPIPHDRLFTTMERNDDVLYEQALERRKEAAASTDDLVQRAAQETDMKVANFEVEIQEIEQKGVDQQIHEVLTMDKNGSQEPQKRRGRPRRN